MPPTSASTSVSVLTTALGAPGWTVDTGCAWALNSSLGVTTSGATVAAWADQSGNGRDQSQASAGARPAYASNLITFDGVDDLLYLVGSRAGQGSGINDALNTAIGNTGTAITRQFSFGCRFRFPTVPTFGTGNPMFNVCVCWEWNTGFEVNYVSGSAGYPNGICWGIAGASGTDNNVIGIGNVGGDTLVHRLIVTFDGNIIGGPPPNASLKTAAASWTCMLDGVDTPTIAYTGPINTAVGWAVGGRKPGVVTSRIEVGKARGYHDVLTMSQKAILDAYLAVAP